MRRKEVGPMKANNAIVGILMLLFLFVQPGTASTGGTENAGGRTIELWKAMEMAEESNPGLKSSFIDTEKSDLDVKIAEGMKSPKIDLWANTTLSDQPSTVVPIREIGVFPPLDTHITRFGLELNIPLYTGGKLEAEKISAQKMSAATSEGYKQRRQDLLYSVVSVFSRSLYFKDLKEASVKRISALEDGERSLSLLLREGRIAKLDLLRLQTHLSQARHDHIVLDQAERDALSLLGTLTGSQHSFEGVVEIPTDVELGALDEIEKTDVLDNSHAVKRSSLLSEAYFAKSKAAAGETKPQVSFFGRGLGNFGSDAELYDDWQAGLQVTVKIWDGYVSKNRIKKSLLDIEKSKLDLDQIKNQTLNEAREAAGAVREAGSKTQTARKQSEEAKEALRIEKLRYESGESTITDLLSAESELWTAEANTSKAYYEKIASEANVLRILGKLSPERLHFSVKESSDVKKMSERDEVVK
jgi:outer membrane protein TolC